MDYLISSKEKIESLEIDDYKIIQSTELYRFTSDSVLLSKFAKPKKGKMRVADFCSGSGIVGLHFFALNSDKVEKCDLFELQSELADMSLRSIKLNKLDNIFSVFNMRIQDINEDKFNLYDLVLCNPPYKKFQGGKQNEDYKIAVCRHEIELTLKEICISASKCLKRSGKFCICHKIERLPELFIELDKCDLHPTRISFVVTNEKEKPYLFLLEATKGTSPQFVVEEQTVNNAKSFSGDNKRKSE